MRDEVRRAGEELIEAIDMESILWDVKAYEKICSALEAQAKQEFAHIVIDEESGDIVGSVAVTNVRTEDGLSGTAVLLLKYSRFSEQTTYNLEWKKEGNTYRYRILD